jgi:hypothetical protein
VPQTSDSRPIEDSFKPPYSPSWFDQLTSVLDRLPGANILYYLALGLIILSISLYLGEIEGIDPNPFNTPVKIFAAFLIVFILSFSDFLDRYASRALDQSRSHFDLTDAAFQRVKYQLTTLPRIPAFLVSLAVATLSLSSLVTFPDFVGVRLEYTGAPQIYLFFEGAIIWWLLGLGAYHTIHQLRVVSRIYSNHLIVNLNNTGAIYSLSRLTALSSLGVIIPISMSILIMPDFVIKPIGFLVGVFSLIIATLTFILPLLDLHTALETEKQRLVDETTIRYEALLNQWHEILDTRQFEGSGELNRAVQAVAAEKDKIASIPTWPWQPGVFRGWVASLFLPLIIWLLQQLLGKSLGT